MKTTILTIIVFLGILLNSKAQVTLEATYDSACFNLYMVNLEISGMKYVRITRDSGNRFIRLYNLNHSIWKTINCNPFPTSYYLSPNMNPPYGMDTTRIFNFDALYITENLFNLDNKVEFLFCVSGFSYYTGIYNEDGTLIFGQDSAWPGCRQNMPQQQVPIYNTSNGTKMILSFPQTNKAKVYGLAGTITSTNSFNNSFHNESLKIFPNPTSGFTTIEYYLPDNIKRGSIDICDMTGTLIKSYTVDNTFHNLTLDGDELSSGMYIYSLIASGKVVESRQIIVTK
jgi:hypothetical protein